MVELRIEDKELLKRLEELGDRAKDGRKPLGAFYQDWRLDVTKSWVQVRADGGRFRGASWPGFKPQYVRSDGAVVPAWGGTPKVRGRGSVKGKKRPSGQRVRPDSIMMQDTGRLRSALLTNAPVVNETTLRIGGTDLPVYAERQFIDYGRNPLFFTAEDAKRFEQRGREYIEELTRKFNK